MQQLLEAIQIIKNLKFVHTLISSLLKSTIFAVIIEKN